MIINVESEPKVYKFDSLEAGTLYRYVTDTDNGLAFCLFDADGCPTVYQIVSDQVFAIDKVHNMRFYEFEITSIDGRNK